MGKIMNNYELLMDFQSQNAGFSQWTYARKNGKFYFLKKFLDPVYPSDDSLSEKLKSSLIKSCEKYEKQNSKFYDKISEIVDGNVVKIIEFFRYDSHYYIATERIDSEKISMEEVAELPLEDRELLCITLAHSLLQLHCKKIIHSDIKADNVMLKKTAGDKLVCKLIDFDCGFFEDNPPENEEELCGDQVYLSPEACLFMCGEETKLTTKMDVFAAGILFHQYLTGQLPRFNEEEYYYAHEAVLDEQELELSDNLSEKHRELIKKMLLCNPNERCDMKEVFETLTGRKVQADSEVISDDDDVSDDDEDTDDGAEDVIDDVQGNDSMKVKKEFNPDDFFKMPKDDDLM